VKPTQFTIFHYFALHHSDPFDRIIVVRLIARAQIVAEHRAEMKGRPEGRPKSGFQGRQLRGPISSRGC